jgi:D-3-phosphoglycerate dehydrogenase / 2-oxoglutarate reductase
MKKKVLIATSSFGEADPAPIEALIKAGFELVLNPHGRTLTESEVIALGIGCSGIISGSESLNSRVLKALPNLQCISRVGIGLDNINLEIAEKNGIIVKNTPDAPTRAVAELAIGLTFDLLRSISRQDRLIRAHLWKKLSGDLLQNKTVGIIGLGRIGKSVAILIKSLGATVIGTDIYPDPVWASNHDIRLKSFDDVLAESDIISVHVPFSRDNRSLIGVNELQKMKKGIYILNLSRGGIIDEEALYRALKSGHIAGAAIDTFEIEPYSGKLTELENVILTPHTGSNTKESRMQMEAEAVDNLIKAFTNEGKVNRN